MLFLLRHATAGHRRPGDDEDELRPLDERGRRQAEALPAVYSDYRITRVLTSPFVRCRASVEPLAEAVGLTVEERIELAEGTTEAAVRALVAEVAGATAVVCTHGDILELLLDEQPEKGSTWVVEPDGEAGGVRRLAYLPPPA